MKTSLNDVEQIENYLFHKLDPQESLVFQARLLTDPVLRENTGWQEKIYALVNLYHRRKLKKAVQAAGKQLLVDPSKTYFKKQITQIFES